jgi:hypothetical protein
MASITTINSMTVEEVSGEEIYHEIFPLAKFWRDISWELRERTEDPDKQKMYERANKVNGFVRTKLKEMKGESHFLYHNTVAVCYGIDLKIRGFAVLKVTHLPLVAHKKRQPIPKPDPEKTFIRLCYLSTDPRNLYGELGYKGVGTSLVQFLFQKCITESFAGIFVEPVPEAVSFFQKFGFVEAINSGSESKNPMLWRPSQPLPD